MNPYLIIFICTLAVCAYITLRWWIESQAVANSLILPPPPPVPLETLFPRDTLNDYQERAMYYHNAGPSNQACYSLGLCTEAGEFGEHIKKHMCHGKDLDLEALKLELGDVLWYLTANATLYNLTLQEIADANLTKLGRRWPKGFQK